MAWPPTTHQDVQDEVTALRGAHGDYFRSGYYSLGTWTGIGATGTSIATSTTYARPFWVNARRAFDRLGINVTTAATAASGGLIQMAIYNQAPGTPGTSTLVETPTVSSETTGAKEWTITVTLDPGVWFLGLRTVVAACSVPVIASGEHNSPFVPLGTTPPASLTGVGSLTTANASGTVAGFPTPVVTAWNVNQGMHLGCLRAA